MSEKRRRSRKNKDEKGTVILARREDNASNEAQPKILLKTKLNELCKSESFSRNDILQRSSLNRTSPNLFKDQSDTTNDYKIYEAVPKMTRPVTLFTSSGTMNSGAAKVLMKNNKDFLVVGIVGTQGVGKSTILNILNNENPDCNYFEKIFVEKSGVFPTKVKQTKWCSRPRTESTHMFISTDRLILLDSPPVLCNSSKKDMISNNLEDLHSVVTYLSICHLIIVVWDDYFNMNFMRLLHFAELMKKTNEPTPLVAGYFPNVLFLKNKAKREDFSCNAKEKLDTMLKAFFQESRFNKFECQNTEIQRSKKNHTKHTNNPLVHTFIFPDLSDVEQVPCYRSLSEIIDELRSLVFMTPRIEMVSNSEFTELLWFDLLLKTGQEKQNFFFDTYETVYNKHYVTNNNVSNENNESDSHENWRSAE